MKPTKYYLYARKSTEEEERQAKSVGDQIAELNELARIEGIKITEVFTENKSAKEPGREIFNQMIQKIYDSKEPIGILAWHPDRLARNSVDGGNIIYLTDIGKITALKFPTFWFEPTPQGVFMLQMAFGQSKYYSDSLSVNVKRGIRQKIRRGEHPNLAPYGYFNNKLTKKIEPHPTTSRIVQQAYKEFAEGKHTLVSLSQRLSFWGLVSRKNTPLGKAAVYRLLTNIVYIGLIRMKGEVYAGSFEPIIDKATFDNVQNELKRKSKPRKAKGGHDFPFTGLIRCGECGGMITAQYAKKGRYIYYRCSKRMGVPCHNPYTPASLLLSQLEEDLIKVAINNDDLEFSLAEIERRQKDEWEEQQSFYKRLEEQAKDNELKLEKLVDGFLDEAIEKDQYLKRKETLLKRKVDLQNKLKTFNKKGAVWFELSREFVKATHQAEKLASSKDLLEIKSFFHKNGLNRILMHKKLGVNFKEPFYLVPKYRALGLLGSLKKEKVLVGVKPQVPSCSGDGT